MLMKGKKKNIDIRLLKKCVKEHYPPDHPLQVIQHEEDIIKSAEEFLNKAEIWLELSDM